MLSYFRVGTWLLDTYTLESLEWEKRKFYVLIVTERTDVLVLFTLVNGFDFALFTDSVFFFCFYISSAAIAHAVFWSSSFRSRHPKFGFINLVFARLPFCCVSENQQLMISRL